MMVGIEGSHEWRSAREAKEFFIMAAAGMAGQAPEKRAPNPGLRCGGFHEWAGELYP